MSISILVWIVPILLLLLIGYRLYGKTPNQSYDLNSNNTKSYLLLVPGLFITVTILVGVFLFKMATPSSKSSTLLTAEMFCEIIDKDSNYIAGFFRDKQFSRNQYYDVNSILITRYSKTYENKVRYVVKSTTEEAILRADLNHIFFYYINDRTKYIEFLNCLIKDGADSAKYIKKYKLSQKTLDQCVLYKNSTFTNLGYDIDADMYTIGICHKDCVEIYY